MTKEEIKKIVEEELKRLEARKHGICTKTNYQLGKISGMIKAFEIAGYLTREESNEIYDYLFD